MEEAVNVPVPPWADLLPDLLRHISGRLRSPADFVRFHAVCQAWRDTLPTSQSHYPLFPPWLLLPGDSTTAEPHEFLPIFSNTTIMWPSVGTCYSCGGHSRWLATEDGVGAWLLTFHDDGGAPPRLVDPFTGVAVTLPPFPEKMRKYAKRSSGVVCSDGAVVLYTVHEGISWKHDGYIAATVLRPGDAAWTEGESCLIMYSSFGHGCAAASHRGSIMLVDLYQMHLVNLTVTSGDGDGDDRLEECETTTRSEPLLRVQRLSIHAFESRGELLAACVVVLATSDDADKDGGGDSGALAAAMSVWVYALEEPEKSAVDGQGSRRQRWVWRDGRSLSDRVLFLGCPTSFAVDAARFAGAAFSGGCVYFVLDSQEAGWSWRNVPQATRVYRYSFEDGSARELGELPDTGRTGWDSDKAMMWIMPHAFAISSTQEIRERRHFKIFVGNLPSWVDGFRLKQFFGNYANVANAEVVCDTRTGRSLEYGFVTMATMEEPVEVFAMLDGQSFFGNVLRVKKYVGERPKGPFVMPLLAQHNKA